MNIKILDFENEEEKRLGNFEINFTKCDALNHGILKCP